MACCQKDHTDIAHLSMRTCSANHCSCTCGGLKFLHQCLLRQRRHSKSAGLMYRPHHCRSSMRERWWKCETDLLKSRPHSPMAQQRGCPARSLSAESVLPSQDLASCGCTPAVKYSEAPGEVSQMSRARMLLLREEPVMMQAETPAFFALSVTASLSCAEQDAPLTVPHMEVMMLSGWFHEAASKAIAWHCRKAVPYDMMDAKNNMHRASWSGY